MENNKNNLIKYALICIIVVVLIVAIFICTNIFSKNDDEKEEEVIVGYAKLVKSENGDFTYITRNNKVLKYTGYSDMSDFYYDTTCVSKALTDNPNYLEHALINKNEKVIIDYGVYNSITQLANGKYYSVEKENKYGVIDYSGNEVIPVEYEYISILSNDETSDILFVGENEDYSYINEDGKILFTASNELNENDIYYFDKFDNSYDTVINVNENGKNRYFDLTSGEELFENVENLTFNYNIQIKENEVVIYNKDMSVKDTIDTSNCTSVSANNKYGKYMILTQMSLVDGKREDKYTIYDSNYNKIFTSENEIELLLDSNNNIYFVISDADNLELYNRRGLINKIENHFFVAPGNNKLDYIVAESLEKGKYDVYNLKGKLVLEGVSNYTYYGETLVVTIQDESATNDYIFINENKKIPLQRGDNVISDSYIIVENSNDKIIKLYDLKGNLISNIENAYKEYYDDNYLIVRNDEKYTIYNAKNGNVSFEYNIKDYVGRDDELDLIELEDGYYNFKSGKILGFNE